VLRVNAAALLQIQIFTHTVNTKLFLVQSETLLVWEDKYEVLMTAALAAVHFPFRQRLRPQFPSIGIWWFYIYISFRINFLRGHGFPKLFRLMFENGFQPNVRLHLNHINMISKCCWRYSFLHLRFMIEDTKWKIKRRVKSFILTRIYISFLRTSFHIIRKV